MGSARAPSAYTGAAPPDSYRAFWWAVLAACAGLGAYLAIPWQHPRLVVWSVLGFGGVVMLVAGVVRNRPDRPWPWLALAAGVALTNVADLQWDIAAWKGTEVPFPGPADVVYLVSYLPLFAGVGGLLARGGPRNRESTLDALILGLGALAVGYVSFVVPIVADSSSTAVATLVAVGYPAMDLVLLAFLARLVFDGFHGNPAIWLACLGALAWLGADMVDMWLEQRGGYALGFPFDSTWMVGYLLLSIAAVHPAMRRLGRRPDEPSRPPGRMRLLLLAVAGILDPALVAVLSYRGDAGTEMVVLGVTGVALFVVVGWRMWLSVSASNRHAGELAAVLRDKQTLENRLRRMAMRDTLTDLANRAAFTEVVAAALRRGHRGLIVMIDLDGFKEVNDTHGHASGDSVLVSAGRRFRGALRSTDTLARLGGDEYAAWLPGIDLEPRARETAGRLAECCVRPFSTERGRVVVTASVGASLARRGDSVDRLMARADHAMYEAKRAGKNGYVVEWPEPATVDFFD